MHHFRRQLRRGNAQALLMLGFMNFFGASDSFWRVAEHVRELLGRFVARPTTRADVASRWLLQTMSAGADHLPNRAKPPYEGRGLILHHPVEAATTPKIQNNACGKFHSKQIEVPEISVCHRLGIMRAYTDFLTAIGVWRVRSQTFTIYCVNENDGHQPSRTLRSFPPFLTSTSPDTEKHSNCSMGHCTPSAALLFWTKMCGTTAQNNKCSSVRRFLRVFFCCATEGRMHA